MTEQIIERLEDKQSEIIADLGIELQPTNVGAMVEQLAEMIESGADPRELELPTSAVAASRLRARQHVPLVAMMRSYRLAQDALWSWLFEKIQAKADDAEQAVALQLTTDWLFAYTDSASLGAERAYEEERDAWLRSTAAARATAIDDVLADRERDPQRASQRLRYDVNRDHVATLIWFEANPDGGEDAGQQELTAICAELAKTVSADTHLTQSAGLLAVRAWLSWGRQSGADQWALPEITRRIGPTNTVRVAMGEPGWGLAGFRRSHLEATQARRVAQLAGQHADTVTHYRDVALVALASADRDQAASFVTRVLGPLAADDESTYRVAMTLAVYLQENRSPARAAKRLTVHPNTVSYRVNQAEAILGREVDVDAVDVSMALALLPLLAGMTSDG